MAADCKPLQQVYTSRNGTASGVPAMGRTLSWSSRVRSKKAGSIPSWTCCGPRISANGANACGTDGAVLAPQASRAVDQAFPRWKHSPHTTSRDKIAHLRSRSPNHRRLVVAQLQVRSTEFALASILQKRV